MLGDENVLIVTMDSCRWDAILEASTPNLDRLGALHAASAQGTFTYPAHMALYQGILPHSFERIPYYNRYIHQLIKIARPAAAPGGALIEFPWGTPDIVRGFAAAGYATFGWGAVGWFLHPSLQAPFEHFVHTGTHASRQVAELIECTAELDRPFFALINFGETHYPYESSEDGPIEIPHLSPARRPVSWTGELDRDGWAAQVRCCEFLDRKLGEVFAHLGTLSRRTIVVITADHGECFGEEGLVGHGFYHPKVMEVPLLIAEVGDDGFRELGVPAENPADGLNQ